MNTLVKEVGSYIIHKYGCCGMFMFFIANKIDKKIRVRSIKTLERAIYIATNLDSNIEQN